MRLRRQNRQAITAAAAFMLGCGPAVQLDEPEYEPDIEGNCNRWCEKQLDCRADPPYGSEAECFASCAESLAWQVPCNEVYEAEQECIVALPCDEFVRLGPNSTTPREEQPCWDKSDEFAACHAENLPEDWDDLDDDDGQGG